MALTTAERQRRFRDRLAQERDGLKQKKTIVHKKEAQKRIAADSGVRTTLEELEENIARLKRQAEAAELSVDATVRDHAAIGAALNAALRLRARALGEGELTDTTVARSAPFRRMLQVIVDSLEPWPAAVKAVAAALERTQGGA